MVEILSKTQIKLLETIAQESLLRKTFYMTGGTPLAAFYLHHRYSEDLDFFSAEPIDAESLRIFFESIKKSHGILKIDFQQSFNRNLFFLHFKNEIVKTEFTYFPFIRIESGKEHYHISCDSLLDIMVNKVFTIYSRSKARDYIDLYVGIHEHGFDLARLIDFARQKFDWHIDPVQLGTQFMKAIEATDFPRMIIDLPSHEWQQFFLREAEKMKDSIVE